MLPIRAGVVRVIRREWRIIVANIIALVLAVSGWNYYDVRYFVNYWYTYFTEGRIFEIYSAPLTVKAAYPPLAIYLFVIPHFLATLISSDPSVIMLIDKTPLIASFNIIYFLLRRRYGNSAGNLWLLNYMAYAVIATYQLDLIAVLFLLLGFIYLTEEKYVTASIMVALSALVKQVLAVFYVFILVLLFRKRMYDTLMKSIASTLLVVLAFSLPFIIKDPWGFILKVVLFHGSRYPQNYSLWAIPLYLNWYNIAVLPSWLSWAWMPLFAASLVVVLVFFYKNASLSVDHLLRYFVITLILLLILNKVGNPNYYVWASPFLAIYLSRNLQGIPKRIITLYILVPLLIGLLAGVFTVYAAAVAGDDILLVEDANWVPADQLVALSMGVSSLTYRLLIYSRSSSVFFTLFSILNSCRSVTDIFVTIIYNAYLFSILPYVIKESRWLTHNAGLHRDRLFKETPNTRSA